MQVQKTPLQDAPNIEYALLDIMANTPEFGACLRSILQLAQQATGASGGFFCSVDDATMNVALNVDETMMTTWNEAALEIEFSTPIAYSPPLPHQIQIPHKAWLIVPMRSQEKIVGLFWLLFDTPMTENDRKQEIAAIVAGVRSIVQAEIRFRDLYRNQSEFVRIVSHDLRSPLTSMQGFASMLETEMIGDLNDKQKHFVSKILSGITQMTGLVDNIQDAGRFDPQTGFYDMSRSQCDLDEIVNNVIENHSVAAEMQQLTLTANVADNVPIINADRNMLERAISNLVDNAIKYTPDNGQVTVDVERKDNQIVIAVKDNGLGVSEDNLKQLFNRHVRIVRKEHKKIKGTGLGLFIVRSVAQRHGGDAWAASKEGKGSTFYISIPLEGDNLI
ncbi:MAG: sensor histidine kinase [Chloroflexi bacterium]|nr:MAG: hypothetical protein CUN54_00395 [Phototrophicales bacterium]RMF79315.1 MAG: sensor histidine kinase [Chloroflexota bacterium]